VEAASRQASPEPPLSEGEGEGEEEDNFAKVAHFLQKKVTSGGAEQQAAGLKKTLGAGVNMSNMPESIVQHQRHLAMLTELQEAIDAEVDMKACVRAVKEARAAKNAKLSSIRAAETRLVEWYPEFVREVGEAKAAVGAKLVLSRIPQSKMNAYAKIAAECKAILGVS